MLRSALVVDPPRSPSFTTRAAISKVDSFRAKVLVDKNAPVEVRRRVVVQVWMRSGKPIIFKQGPGNPSYLAYHFLGLG
jgi:hypothetical protein